MTKQNRRAAIAALTLATATAGMAQEAPVPRGRDGGAIPVHRLSAGIAHEIVGAAVGYCAQQGYRVSAVVVDTDGVRQSMLRGDGAPIHTLESSFHKAFTAVTFETDTIDLVAQSKVGPVSTSLAKLPNLLLAQGGVVIRFGAEVIGAVGVGGGPGGDIDTRCARAGLDKVADRIRPASR